MATEGSAKPFLTFARDYRLTDEGPARGGFLVPGTVQPVCIVDDCVEYQVRSYPLYFGREVQAAVAAVYPLIGLAATSPRAVRILGIEVVTAPATGAIGAIAAVSDLRTDNQADGTADVGSWPRGQAAPTAQLLSGTTTVALGAGRALLYGTLGILADNPFVGKIMRPNEFIWCQGTVVNETFTIAVAWEELRFPPPPTPADL